MSFNTHIQLGIDWPPDKPYPNDAREMRQEILRNSRYSQVIREAEDVSRHLGLNGEDATTLLAFIALVQLERYFLKDLRRLMLEPFTPIVKESPHG
jgi:hypothetical protein